jgi:hypothetical protein
VKCVVNEAKGTASQATQEGDALDDVAAGSIEIGICRQHLERSNGHAHEAQRGAASILDANVGPHLEGVVAGAHGAVGRVHTAVAQEHLALTRAEAGEGTASAQAFGVIHRCSLSHMGCAGRPAQRAASMSSMSFLRSSLTSWPTSTSRARAHTLR